MDLCGVPLCLLLLAEITFAIMRYGLNRYVSQDWYLGLAREQRVAKGEARI